MRSRFLTDIGNFGGCKSLVRVSTAVYAAKKDYSILNNVTTCYAAFHQCEILRGDSMEFRVKSPLEFSCHVGKLHEDSTKFHCVSMESYILDFPRKFHIFLMEILFWRKTLNSDNTVIRVLATIKNMLFA